VLQIGHGLQKKKNLGITGAGIYGTHAHSSLNQSRHEGDLKALMPKVSLFVRQFVRWLKALKETFVDIAI